MQSTEPSESERAALEVVLTAHGLRAAGPAERVSAGTLNRNFRVPIEGGRNAQASSVRRGAGAITVDRSPSWG